MNKKKIKAVKLTEGVVHLIVGCVECGSIYEDYTQVNKAHEIAKKHVAETSHEVHVEIGKATIYVPEEQK